MGQGQPAAVGQCVPEGGDDSGRVLLGRDEVQDRDHEHGDRLVEVDQLAHLRRGQDVGRPPDVGVDDVGVRVVGEQGEAVGDGHRVLVDVDHPGLRARRLGHLVDVALRRYPRAEVDELPDTGPGQEAHRPPEEGPVGAGQRAHLGVDGRDGRHRFPVDGEVVLPAQHRVVHPGYARLVRIGPWRQSIRVGHQNVLSHQGT